MKQRFDALKRVVKIRRKKTTAILKKVLEKKPCDALLNVRKLGHSPYHTNNLKTLQQAQLCSQ